MFIKYLELVWNLKCDDLIWFKYYSTSDLHKLIKINSKLVYLLIIWVLFLFKKNLYYFHIFSVWAPKLQQYPCPCLTILP